MNRILDERVFQAIEEMARLQRAILEIKSADRALSQQQRGILLEGPLEQLRQLEWQLEQYAFADDAEFWMTASGDDIDWGATSIDCLTSLLQSIRIAFQQFVLHTRRQFLPGISARQAKAGADFRIAAFQPGSMRIGFRLASVPQSEQGIPLVPNYSIALHAFLQTARGLAEMKTPEWFPQYMPGEQNYRKAQQSFLPLLLSIRDNNLETLSFCDPSDLDNVITFRRSTVEVLEKVLLERTYEVRSAALEAPRETRVVEVLRELSGRVREIDLDQLKLKLREESTQQDFECEFGPDLIESIKRALDADVVVLGSKSGRRRFKIVSLTVTPH